MPGLRPLGLGEILDVGVRLYLRHWRTLVLCVVGLVLPAQLLSVLTLLSVSPDALDPRASEPALEPGDEETLVAYGVTSLLQALVYAIATAACFKAVSDAYLGAEPAAGRSLAFAVKALPRLLLLALLLVGGFGLVFGGLALLGPVALGVGVMLLVAPTIWLAISWSLSVPALLFEGGSPWRALARSFTLVKGRWWQVFGVLLVGVLLVSFLAGIMQAILQLVPAVLADGDRAVLAISSVVAGTVGGVITTPFTAAVVALLYFDQRVRKEGFDRRGLAAGLGRPYDPGEGGWQPPRPPPWPPPGR
jgi:Membrane domain of glycerophosphoryl diester phosphodiesterase